MNSRVALSTKKNRWELYDRAAGKRGVALIVAVITEWFTKHYYYYVSFDDPIPPTKISNVGFEYFFTEEKARTDLLNLLAENGYVILDEKVKLFR